MKITMRQELLIRNDCCKEAVESAGISDINEYRTGLISSTSVGGMDITEKYFYTYEDFPEKQKYIDAHDAGNSSWRLQIILA
jgi:3-oxoacyl-[acyl-carrier-protein] synthase-1